MLKKLTYERLDSIIIQTEVRFQDFHNLKFIELTNNNEFNNYKKHFPNEKFNQLLKHAINYNIFVSAELQEVYVELTKLLQLILCILVTTVSSERIMSTLKRIKTFLKNTMTHDRFLNLGTIAIEKKILSELATDPTFIDNVIDLFSKTKNRKIDLIY
ncbi:Zinc finger MYM-type protein 1 [Aphis craccivora]|uniref:Zinc finger MYM-type protein 1 n=1 Tax=Aphis craccivora TaxID=307492 RepID=A0A6G0VR19_APHCR|nr:Zinc finger MYM-type protein 1 [Aphis craccivora]